MATTIVSTAQEEPPVSVEEARRFCRLFDDSHDEVLRLLIDAAIDFIEGQLREQLRVRTWQMTATAGEITAGMVLPKWPVLELVSLSVNGSPVNLAGIGVDQFDWPARLAGPIPTGTTQVLTWKAGYLQISAARKLLILQVVADYHRQREASGGERDLSIGTKLLLEGENQHIDAVRG